MARWRLLVPFRGQSWQDRFGLAVGHLLAAAPFAQIALLPLTTPRVGTISQLDERLASGEVTAVFFGIGWTRLGRATWLRSYAP